MTKSIIRVILGLQGLVAILIATQAFLKPHELAQQLGYALVGDLGISSFRADIGAFFAVTGIFMLWGAVRSNANLLVPPLLLAGTALGARTATVVLSGYVPEYTQPMAVEAVTVVMLLIGYINLGRH